MKARRSQAGHTTRNTAAAAAASAVDATTAAASAPGTSTVLVAPAAVAPSAAAVAPSAAAVAASVGLVAEAEGSVAPHSPFDGSEDEEEATVESCMWPASFSMSAAEGPGPGLGGRAAEARRPTGSQMITWGGGGRDIKEGKEKE